MIVGTIIELVDVTGKPKAKIDLPYPLRIGDRVTLNFTIVERFNGRYNVLEVKGEVRVASVAFDASKGILRQLVGVEATGSPFVWKSVKNLRQVSPKLGLAKKPKTTIR